MPNEILIQKRQRYWYDRCMEFSGARLVEVGNENNTSVVDFEKMISEKTLQFMSLYTNKNQQMKMFCLWKL